MKIHQFAKSLLAATALAIMSIAPPAAAQDEEPAATAEEKDQADATEATAADAADATDATDAADAADAEAPREVILRQDKTNPLAFAENEFTATAGERIKLTMDNTTSAIPQPHNVLVCLPDSMKEIIALASAAITDPAYMTGGCIVESDKVLHFIKLVQPGQTDSVEFTVPEDPGDYPFICTFPGHWTTMNGIMKVVAAGAADADADADAEPAEEKKAE